MQKLAHFVIGLFLAAVTLICCLMMWDSRHLFDMDWSVLAIIFLVIFGASSMVCSWGAFQHIRRALRVGQTGSILSSPWATASMVVGIAISTYVLSYSILSVRGAYGPFTAGANGIKDYAWYPDGYLDRSNHWRMLPFNFYFPIWVLDINYWHDEARFAASFDKTRTALAPSH